MKELNLTEIFQEFDKQCFELAKEDYYSDLDEFVDDVCSYCHAPIARLYEDDDEEVEKKRIYEYLDEYNYRDPATNMSKTFLEWSQFFNDEYSLQENLIEMYEKCAELNKEINSYKQKIKELSFQKKEEQETDKTPIHTKIRNNFTNDVSSKVLNDIEKTITDIGFGVIRLGDVDDKGWLTYMTDELWHLVKEKFELSNEEWQEYLLEIWNYNTSELNGDTKTLKEWYEYLMEDTTDEENEENIEEYDKCASSKEMKDEAIYRMRAVLKYTDIIDGFIEYDLPQVYEPPYGASYALEKDELDRVRAIEKKRNVLVWGVIRSFMQYNRQQVTVDCMLHVSSNKEEWEQEREDLFSGCPFVYTTMKEHELEDSGHISIYQSEGGTLLRQ